MKPNKLFSYIPLLSIVFFIILFSWAAYIYPCYGVCDEHYSWGTTYWCNLLAFKTKANNLNEAFYIANTAWILLCFGVSFFWYQISKKLEMNKTAWIAICGISSMLISIFIGSSFHDPIILAAGFLGFVAFALTIYYIRLHYPSLALLGLFCMFLSSLNYFIYFSGFAIDYLAAIQKISFAFYFMWFLWTNHCIIILSNRNTANSI